MSSCCPTLPDRPICAPVPYLPARAGNRLLSDNTFSYTYDNEGNRKSRTRISGTGDDYLTEYTWDNRNRLTGITLKNNQGASKRTLTYRYDDANRLVRRIVDLDGNGTTDAAPTYIYQGSQIVLEKDAGNQLKHRYLWGAVVDELLADEQIGGELLWALEDREGTVRDLVNNLGVVRLHRQYNSFGRITSKSGTADMLFANQGRLLDQDAEMTANDGLENHTDRWYDPRASYWISADPSGFASNDPNFYRACGNNWLIHRDPLGLQSEYSGQSNYNITTTATTVFGSVIPAVTSLTSGLLTGDAYVPQNNFSGGNLYTVSGSLPGYSPITIPSTSNLSSLGISSLGGSVLMPSYNTFTSTLSTASIP